MENPNKQTFTRAEVRKLLKQQIKASANSYGKMNMPDELMYNRAYGEENIKVYQRLSKVSLIKF